MNVRDVLDVAISRRQAVRVAKQERKDQIFLNQCLRAIDGRDAYHHFVYKASKILHCCSDGEAVHAITQYYFNHVEHFDCSFEEWLSASNGPIVRNKINELFPELELITSNKYEIAKLAEEKYGVKMKFDFEGFEVYSLEFNFKEINKKRANMDEIKEQIKKLVMEEL